MITVFYPIVNINPNSSLMIIILLSPNSYLADFYAILYSMSNYIAVDIGGTQIRAGLYPRDGLEPIKLERASTRHPTATPLERMIELIASIWPEDNKVAAIGTAAPGPIDPRLGIIREAPNIQGWVNIPLRKHLEDHFHVPIALGNDANLAALGEWKYGSGKGHHDLLYLTISTGIGGGVIIDDRLMVGANGLAAELGHVTVLPGGPLCGCGLHGHLEAVASGPAIARWAEQELQRGVPTSLIPGPGLTAKAIGMAAATGDELAIAALARSGTFIGRALADYLHIFNPSIVIIGGGVSQAGSFLMDPIRTSINENVISPYYTDNLILTTAALRDVAGLMGALALARSLAEETNSSPFFNDQSLTHA
jgi:glucokinase